MTRAELLEHICFTNYTNECSAVDGRYNCQDCKDAINPLLDEYDKQIKVDAYYDGFHKGVLAETKERLAVMKEFEQEIRADAIEEIKTALNNKSVQITFDLPVEELLGEDVDLDDFAMLVQDAVQVYRKMVFGVLEELKEQNK